MKEGKGTPHFREDSMDLHETLAEPQCGKRKGGGRARGAE